MPGRLEVDVLDGPAHRPVDLPDELALEVGGEVGDALVAGDVAGVGEVGGLLVVRRQGDRVAAAVAAVGLVGEAGQVAAAGGLVLVGRLQLDGLGAVLGQHGLDRVALADRGEHGVLVVAGPVALGLRDLLHVDAHRVQGVAQGRLEVVGPRRVAALGVRHGGERAADVLAPRRVDADRHLAEPVEVVPDVEVPGREASATQLLGDEVHRQELAQVAQVDPTGRAGAARDGDDLRAARLRGGRRRRRRASPSRGARRRSSWPPANVIGLSRAERARRAEARGVQRRREYAAGSTRQVRCRSGP